MRCKEGEVAMAEGHGRESWPDPPEAVEREDVGPRGCLDLSDNDGGPRGTMHLSRALDNISLAYNPITKQLHFVSPKQRRVEAPPPERDPESLAPPESPPPTCDSDESRGSSSAGNSPPAKPKNAFSGFFSRGVFPWKSNGFSSTESKSPPKNDANGNSLGLNWKLFSSGRSNSVGCASTDSLGTDTPASSGASTPLHHRRQGSNASAGELKQFEDLVASSVALIQHNRPSNLPAKDTAEEQRHRAEYQRMVVAARQREAREAKERKRQLAKQARHEDDLSAALKEWNQNILPSWESLKNARKTRDLWWCGLPPAVRGKIWQLAIPNHLNITPQLYVICVERAKQRLIEAKLRRNGFKMETKKVMNGNLNHSEDKLKERLKSDECCEKSSDSVVSDFNCNKEDCDVKTDKCAHHQDKVKLRLCEKIKDSFMPRNYSEQNLNKQCAVSDDNGIKKISYSNPDLCKYSNECSMELIQLDISRTFPHLCIFQPGGPYFDVLHELLAAYVCYRPDVGYVQGMSFLAAILILNMDAPEAFICFANLLNGTALRAAFARDGNTMQVLWLIYSHIMEANLPCVYKHFLESGLGPELYLLEWLYSVFAKAMPLDVACRVWDVFLRDGDEFLFRTALGVLHLYQDKLVKLDFITAAQFLTKLPEDLCSDSLFKSINSINMTVDKLSFQQMFDKYKDNSPATDAQDSIANIL